VQIPDEFRKCVAFLAVEDTDSFRFIGTCFFVSRPAFGNRSFRYLVTARHVVDDLLNGVDKLLVRLNTKIGDAVWSELPMDKWTFHPTDNGVDVAVMAANFDWSGFDHFHVALHAAATKEVMKREGFGIGDEVFVTGLFRHYKGERRNIPIIRIGNISALGEEKVQTKRYGAMEAYLVECRSIGGLSGSPVFLHSGAFRVVNNALKPVDISFYLLGLIHGHWDTDAVDVDAIEDATNIEKINTGIAIIVPVDKILEVLNHPNLIKREMELNEKQRMGT
jgi:hypothetical protein